MGKNKKGEPTKQYRIRLKSPGHFHIELYPPVMGEKVFTSKAGVVVGSKQIVIEKAVRLHFHKSLVEDPPGSGWRRPELYVLTDDEYLDVITHFEKSKVQWKGYVEEEFPVLKHPLPKSKIQEQREQTAKELRQAEEDEKLEAEIRREDAMKAKMKADAEKGASKK